jgi:eukaryotic-like serine/threonine-protein kinase
VTTTSFSALLQSALGNTYTIDREIGRGAMSRVFLATEHALGRRIVLKVLRPELAADVNADRFRREIRLLSQLHHPHLVPVHSAGQAGFFLYYTMPYIEGETLRMRLDRKPTLPIEHALRIGYEIASALDYAHRHNVLHRDIKPENVLLEDGHAVVADFGVARALNTSSSERITRTGITLGTPAYMSPEQASGDQELDARSDIYSLGCVVFEMIGERPPFTGVNTQVAIARRFTEAAPPLRRFRAEVPEAVERTVAKSLEREPSQRFQTAAEFARTLDLVRLALRGAEHALPNVAPESPADTSPPASAPGSHRSTQGTRGASGNFDWRRLRFW